MPDPQPSAAQLSEDGFTTTLGRMTQRVLGMYRRRGTTNLKITNFDLLARGLSYAEIDTHAEKAIAQAREIYAGEKKDG